MPSRESRRRVQAVAHAPVGQAPVGDGEVAPGVDVPRVELDGGAGRRRRPLQGRLGVLPPERPVLGPAPVDAGAGGVSLGEARVRDQGPVAGREGVGHLGLGQPAHLDVGLQALGAPAALGGVEAGVASEGFQELAVDLAGPVVEAEGVLVAPLPQHLGALDHPDVPLQPARLHQGGVVAGGTAGEGQGVLVAPLPEGRQAVHVGRRRAAPGGALPEEGGGGLAVGLPDLLQVGLALGGAGRDLRLGEGAAVEMAQGAPQGRRHLRLPEARRPGRLQVLARLAVLVEGQVDLPQGVQARPRAGSPRRSISRRMPSMRARSACLCALVSWRGRSSARRREDSTSSISWPKRWATSARSRARQAVRRLSAAITSTTTRAAAATAASGRFLRRRLPRR
jgi:hypothetical protein